eukprot:Opistho-2@70747
MARILFVLFVAAAVVGAMAAPNYPVCQDLLDAAQGKQALSDPSKAPVVCSGHGKVHARLWCACEEGFYGPCCEFDIDECGYAGTCDVHATCENTLGDRKCACMEGFSGDGLECVDIAPPVLTINQETTLTLKQYDSFVDPGASAADNLDGDLTGKIKTDSDVTTAIPGTYTVQYTVVDAAGNKATFKRSINVLDIDECSLARNSPFADKCHERASCANTDGSYTCTCDRGYNGDGFSCVDVEAPVVVIDSDADITVFQYATFDAPSASVGDNSGETINIDVVNPVDSKRPGRYVVVYSATDSAGNVGSASINVEVFDVDECIYTGLSTANSKSRLPFTPCHVFSTCTNTIGSYICVCISGYAGDGFDCKDVQPPTLLLKGNPVERQPQFTPYVDDGATAFDNHDGDLTRGIQSSGSVDVNTPGTYVITYSVRDIALNEASITRQVTIDDVDECAVPSTHPQFNKCNANAICTNTIGAYSCKCKDGFQGNGFACKDITPPALTVRGSSVERQEQYTAYTDDGASSIDNLDGDITSKIVSSGTVDVKVPGEYIISYTISDATGNQATATRKVTIVDIDECQQPKLSATAHKCDEWASCKNTIGSYTCKCDNGFVGDGFTCKDITPPTVELKGASVIVLDQFSAYADEGALAVDNKDGDLTAKITVSGSVDTRTVGEYTLTFSATDATGNTGSIKRSVSVQDVDECAVGSANDNAAKCDKNAYCTNRVNSYDCICNDGFSGDGKTCRDVTPPVITTAISETFINQYDTFIIPSATANDNYDGSLTAKVVPTS